MINAGGRNETNSPVSVRVLKAGGWKATVFYTLRIYLYNENYATFTPPAFDMTGDSVAPRCTPAWNPITFPISGVYASGTVVSIRAFYSSPNNIWQFDVFTGALTGGANPQNLTMNADKTVIACFSNVT